jgi:hypothetical protein
MITQQTPVTADDPFRKASHTVLLKQGHEADPINQRPQHHQPAATLGRRQTP